MVLSPKSYYEDSSFLKSRAAAEKPMGWFEQSSFDWEQALIGVAEDDIQVLVVLLLQSAFGLRIAEASQCHPLIGDQGTHLNVNWGPKGGRKRAVPIREDYQRQVLNIAKRFAVGPSGSMIPKQYSKKQWLDHMNYVLRKHGICRKNGLTSHGLRHSYAIRIYEFLSGSIAPVKGIRDPHLNPEKAKLAQQITAQHLGHNRGCITNMYTGNPKALMRKPDGVEDSVPEEDIQFFQSNPTAHHRLLNILQNAMARAEIF